MSAILSDCGNYRYSLEREIGDGHRVCVLMINPSTADHQQDDPTIRKLRGFGQRNGWGSFEVGNLFAYRATDVRDLGKVRDPVGPLNDEYLIQMLARADQVLLAWGPLSKQPARYRNRYQNVMALVDGSCMEPWCIGPPALDGHPKHPARLAYETPLQHWIDPLDVLLR